MSGLGYKTFASGEILTAANLQGYATDQSVMVFASVADRTTQLAAPSQGMVSFLNDTGTLWQYYAAYGVGNPGGATTAGWYPISGAAMFYGTATRSTTSGTDYTIGASGFTYTEYIDPLAWHSTATNTDRITPTVAGLYRVTNVATYGANASNYRRAVINVSGSLVTGAATLAVYAPAATATAVVALNGSSDYVTCATYQDSTATLTVTSRVTVEFLRPLQA